MQVRPNLKQIKEGLAFGWPLKTAIRGYDIFDCNGTGLLEINRIDDILGGTDVTDEDCAYEAQKSGFCDIIPISELPAEFPYRYFGWVDTPENRSNIVKFTKGGRTIYAG